MLVVIELSDLGRRVIESGQTQIRGHAQDADGNNWDVRVQLAALSTTEGMVMFLTPDACFRFLGPFEVKNGRSVIARCTPVHGHD